MEEYDYGNESSKVNADKSDNCRSREAASESSKVFEAVGREKLREGTILELKVQTPEGKKLISNVKLTKEDEKLISELLKNKDTLL